MNETTDAAAIFSPLWKRKWLILCVGVLVAAAAYGYYRHRPTVYSASTQLYLGVGSEEQELLGGSPGKTTLNDRAVADQATLINSSAVGEPVHRRLREHHNRAALAGKVRASASTGSDFITIVAEAATSRGAVSLADDYAQAYIDLRRSGYQRDVKAAITATRRRLRRIEAAQTGASAGVKGKAPAAAGGATAIQAADLLSKINQFESDLSLSGVQQISSGTTKATLLSPTPKRNAIFGFVLGLLLAAVAAYAVSRFDRRLRTMEGIEALFRTQILAALPDVREPIVRRDGRPEPAEGLLEPLRRLHTTLQLGDMLEHDRERAPRSILFVGCDAGDGVSTAIAGLALVQRDAGERVAVVDADLRAPAQAKLLGAGGPRGLTDVLAGTLAPGDALQRLEQIAAPGASGGGTLPAQVSTAIGSRAAASVSVLASGSPVANPPALLASRAMTDLLHSLAEDFDHVLIDAPPPLSVSDAMGLLGAVDGIMLVARVGHAREVSAQRLMQLLAHASSAPVLGVLAVSVPSAELRRYGLSAPPSRRRRTLKPIV
jgi:polysaccharide biosynthesis transport protein